MHIEEKKSYHAKKNSYFSGNSHQSSVMKEKKKIIDSIAALIGRQILSKS